MLINVIGYTEYSLLSKIISKPSTCGMNFDNKEKIFKKLQQGVVTLIFEFLFIIILGIYNLNLEKTGAKTYELPQKHLAPLK
jgi:hypothetical protein